jgi:glycosyltransferase involved in cell wall biosynthesis
MRILHVSTRLILGGSQENTVLSCEGQARLGHEVHLAFGPIYGPEGSLLERVQAFRTSDGRGIATHVIPNMVREVSPLRDLRAERELLTLIRELRPDVVHTHSSKAGIIGRRAAWKARGPAVVHTIHGPPFMPIEGSFPRRLKTRLNNWIYTLAERHAAHRCHSIVSVADAMTRQYLARGIGNPSLYTTVRSGMEIGPYLNPAPGQSREEVRRELGLMDTDFVIGTVARLAEHKGHDDLLDALAADLRANPHWRLLWVGNGWWRERLLSKARQLGISISELDVPRHAAARLTEARAQLVVTGLVPPERIPAMMRAMDVLAHPSYREGLPRTVPQALLCGVCPVAYDVDGTGEACREMQTGRLVPLADLQRLRDAIAWCAAHPEERRALASAGQRECSEAFSAEKMVADLERVYQAALERRSAR